MVDRHMGAMDRYLFAGHFFHGHLKTAEYRIRAWALIITFALSVLELSLQR